ncbi:unnamed protein product [Rhizophagus irregularis]|nr:unnamed protein product [Rhizophagus irregularis]
MIQKSHLHLTCGHQIQALPICQQIQETTSKIFQDFSLITKAISITIDNDANQVSGMKLLKDILLNDFKVKLNIVRCGAHTVALAINAGLKEFKPVIDKVRAFIIEIRRSSKKEQVLLEFSEKFQVKYIKLTQDI